LLILSRSISKHVRNSQFFFQIGQFLKSLLLWNRLAKWIKTGKEASMEGPLKKLLLSSRSVYKHGHHRQFLFLVISKKKSPLKPRSQMNRNLVGSTYGMLCIKFPKKRMKGEPTEPLVSFVHCVVSPPIYSFLWLVSFGICKLFFIKLTLVPVSSLYSVSGHL